MKVVMTLTVMLLHIGTFKLHTPSITKLCTLRAMSIYSIPFFVALCARLAHIYLGSAGPDVAFL